MAVIPMKQPTHGDPHALLRELERRCRTHAEGLPLQIDVEEEWLGIGFRLGNATLVAPLGEVTEILHYPSLSRVPGAKSWVKGIANIRGNLLPVMDLQGYLKGEPVTMGPRSRVLVVNYKGVVAGLLVDEVLGLKHFLEEEHTTELPEVDESVVGYLQGAYEQGGFAWGVFSMQRLAENPLFMQVAV
jgi:twitching motility protein PilI